MAFESAFYDCPSPLSYDPVPVPGRDTQAQMMRGYDVVHLDLFQTTVLVLDLEDVAEVEK